jgi:ABC-type lipoprotein release transport system permease subunit
VILKNLFRRKARTFLTLVAIAIGVAAIVALGAIAKGMKAGFLALTQGSQADLVLSQADALSALMSNIDQEVTEPLLALPEVDGVDGMLVTNALIEDTNMMLIFGYDPEGFAIDHFRIVEGQALDEVRRVRGKPLILGQRKADAMGLGVGDTLHVTNSAFRIVGVYETGTGFEDGAAVVALQEAQTLALQPRRVSQLYLRLRDPSEVDRLTARIERRFPELAVSTTSGFVEQEQLLIMLDAIGFAIAALAIMLGGIGMMNALYMSVFERTHEIGVLRALGWRRRQILALILSESLLLALLGGLLGCGLGLAAVYALSTSTSWLGVFGSQLSVDLFVRALVTVLVLGFVGGGYPAWWASRLAPVEALRYEGGSQSRVSRLPSAVARGLWQRRTRTLLTLGSIGGSIAIVVALGGVAGGMLDSFTAMMRESKTDLFVAEAGIDADFSAIDERVGTRLSAHPQVHAVSGMFWTGVSTADMPMLLVSGLHPRELAIQRYRILEGQPMSGRHQVLLGHLAAEQMGLGVGDTLRLLDSRFRVCGIYETGVALEDAGVVIGMREAQSLIGKPRQVQFYLISLDDPEQAVRVKEELAAEYPDLDFALTSELEEAVSDFRVMQDMVAQISFVAVFIGGLGMLNTMLMSVVERTREIGVLRSLGWRRRQVLSMILKESLVLGLIGGLCGVPVGLGLGALLGASGIWGGALAPTYTPQLIMHALLVAVIAGVVGGLYPAWRATRMRPVEALRYE